MQKHLNPPPIPDCSKSLSFITCPTTDHIDCNADNITHKPMKVAVLWDVTSCRLVEVYLITEDIADSGHRTPDTLLPDYTT
jgi:hypothetical protein